MMSEHALQTEIFNQLVDAGCLVIRINQGTRRYIKFAYWLVKGGKKLPKGISDILGITPNGRFFAVECKTIGEVMSPEQIQFFDEVRVRGGWAFLAYSLEDVKILIDTAAGNG